MTGDPIDMTVFGELQDATGSDFVAELVTTFLEEAPGMLSELADAAARGERDGYRRAAHSIKSNANIFGARAVSDMARQMEIDGLGDDPQAVRELLVALSAELDRAADALRTLKDG